MRSPGRQLTYHAVIFFDGERLVKEMLYAEFEAVLDHVVGLSDFAGREIRACFLRVNTRHQIVGAVFFLVDFDTDGFVCRSWNLPLQHLLDKAERGPDFGAGRIRLACLSQCPVAWHRRQLWDPHLGADGNTFALLSQAVQRNRLGLPRVADEESESLPPGVALEDVSAAAEVAAAQFSLQLAAVRSEAQQQAEQIHQHYRIQLNELQASFESTKQLFRDEKQRNRLLHERLAQQEAEISAVRQAVERELAQQGADASDLSELRQQFELELKLGIEREKASLHEMLNMREVELFYREEQLGGLREEVARLRQERDRLVQRGSARLLELLTETAVTLVVYSPGGEAIHLPPDAMADYLDNPAGWLAAKLNMSRDDYELWRRHCAAPVCGAAEVGGQCGEPLPAVTDSAAFFPGISDCCERHRVRVVAVAEVS